MFAQEDETEQKPQTQVEPAFSSTSKFDFIPGEQVIFFDDFVQDNILKENPAIRVKIIGHTDSDGGDALNLALSKKRAEAVKNALVSQYGIEGARLETDGKGASQPVSPNTSPAGE